MWNMDISMRAAPSSLSLFLYSQWQGQAYHRSALVEGKGSKYLPSEE